MKRFLRNLGVVGAISVLTLGILSFIPAESAHADPFTCRASVVRVTPQGRLAEAIGADPIERVIANGPNNPCVTASTGVVPNQALPANLGTLRVLFANTQNTTDTATTSGGANSEAGVNRTELILGNLGAINPALSGLPTITTNILTAQAQAACGMGTAAPTLASQSQVARVTVGPTTVGSTTVPGQDVNVDDLLPAERDLPLGLGKIFFNREQREPNKVTRRAFELQLNDPLIANQGLANIVIAEAIADFQGNPCNHGTVTPTTVDPTTGDPTTGNPTTGNPTTGNPTTGTTTGPGDTDGPPQCSDEVDNDGDGFIDHPNDPGCESPQDDDERDNPPPPQCSDGVDNDGDGDVDYPADPGCENRDDDDETNPPLPECSDGIDNDGDGTIDFPLDTGCKSPLDDDEAAGFITGGGGYDEMDRQIPPEDLVNPGERLRHGLALPCDIGDPPGPNLVVTWHGDDRTEKARFKLDTLTRAFCRNDPFIDPGHPDAEFDTYVGEATGTLTTMTPLGPVTTPNVTAEFIIDDRGEPGAPPVIGVDFFSIKVPADVPVALAEGSGTLDEGNHQAHTPGRPAGTTSGTSGSTGTSKGKKQ